MGSGGSGTTTAVPRGWSTPAPDGSPRAHRRSDVVFGLVLVVLWATWLVLTALSQPREVTADRFAADLSAGRVTVWQRVELLPTDGPEGWSADLTWRGVPQDSSAGTGASDPPTSADSSTEGVATGSASTDDDSRANALRYEVSGHVVPVRFVATDALPQGEHAMVAALRSAGVPAVGDLGAPFVGVDDPGGPFAGAGLVLLTLGAIVLGPEPTRGTRWCWFWLLWVTLGLGVLAYAVLEQVRPAAPRAESRARSRRTGGFGFLVMLFVGPLVAAGLTWVVDETHWLLLVRPG